MGWIVALPSVPLVAEADPALFVELMRMTRPYEHDDAFAEGCSSAMGGDYREVDAVDVESRQVVGAFDVTTVASDSTAALAAWIAGRGFVLEDGSDEILQFYVDKGWHFVAIGIDLEQAAADGFLPPILFSFDSEKPVFPLRISAINGLGVEDGDGDWGEGATEVLVYAAAKSVLSLDGEGIAPEFAHALDGADLAEFPAVRAALPGSGALVKFRLFKYPEEMTDDLAFSPAANGAAMLARRGGGIDLAWIAIGIAVLGAALRFRRRVRPRG
jgi:hypothetical protein